uniref:Uncharacterized protein n=1 Tax=Leptobrachium leishanense TaxID=445787 RepID=A0A8C5QA64_9ANUR
MREHGHYRGDILHKTFFPYPVMLQRAKYSRFRNDSLASTEEGTQSVSLNSKPCAETHAPGTSSLPVENVSPVSQDTSTTICTLIPKKYHFKLSSPTSLLGFKHFTLGMKDASRAKPTESPASPSSTTSAEITSSSHLNSSTPSRPNADVDVKNSNNIKKRTFLQSMRSLDFGTRTQVTR